MKKFGQRSHIIDFRVKTNCFKDFEKHIHGPEIELVHVEKKAYTILLNQSIALLIRITFCKEMLCLK